AMSAKLAASCSSLSTPVGSATGTCPSPDGPTHLHAVPTHAHAVQQSSNQEPDEPGPVVDRAEDGREWNATQRRHESGETGRNTERQRRDGHAIESGRVFVGSVALVVIVHDQLDLPHSVIVGALDSRVRCVTCDV